MATECAYDYVFVYDGSHPVDGRLLGSFSGLISPPPQKLLARSGSMLVVLFSDTNYVMQGFKAEYFTSNCPHDCNGRGVCINPGGVCDCDHQFVGEDCSEFRCPNDCGATDGRGECSKGGCICKPGYAGVGCSLDVGDSAGNSWHVLNHPLFIRTTSHASVYDPEGDTIYIYGGYDLNNVSHDLLSYDFKRGGTWLKVKRSGDPPPPLYDHAMALVPGGFVVHGGIDHTENTRNELWFFNITRGNWVLEATKLNPSAVSKHTLTMASDGYLYMFGGSLSHGEFSSGMFRISGMERNRWERLRARGSIHDLQITGHSMVHYDNALYLYGGFRVDTAKFSRLSGTMYRFDLKERAWSELRVSGPPERAFHSADVVGDYMLVFGGYSHRHNQIENCYDKTMHLFHLKCHTWVSERILAHKGEGRLYNISQGMFGHSTAVRTDSVLFVSGGYHGSVSSAVMAYTLPLALKSSGRVCPHYRSQASCSSNPECGWCPSDSNCYLRTSTGNCTVSNLQARTCPGK